MWRTGKPGMNTHWLWAPLLVSPASHTWGLKPRCHVPHWAHDRSLTLSGNGLALAPLTPSSPEVNSGRRDRLSRWRLTGSGAYFCSVTPRAHERSRAAAPEQRFGCHSWCPLAPPVSSERALSCRAKNSRTTVCGHGHQEVTGVFHPLSESAFGRSLCLTAPDGRGVV